MGDNRYDNREFMSALNSYHRALVNAPQQIITYYNAAITLIELQEYDRAKELLQFFITNTSNNSDQFYGYYTLGIIEYRQGNIERAINAFQNALLANQTDEDTRYNLEILLQQHENQISSTSEALTPTQDSSNRSMNATATALSTQNNIATTPELAVTLSRAEAEQLLNALQNALPTPLLTTTHAPNSDTMNW
jgi:tetratricopeptide (TPR) repeat protein